MPLLHFIWSELEQSSLDTMKHKASRGIATGATILRFFLQTKVIISQLSKQSICHVRIVSSSGSFILKKDCMLLYFTIPKILQCIVAALRVNCKLSSQQPDLHFINQKEYHMGRMKVVSTQRLHSLHFYRKRLVVHYTEICIFFWYMNSVAIIDEDNQ